MSRMVCCSAQAPAHSADDHWPAAMGPSRSRHLVPRLSQGGGSGGQLMQSRKHPCRAVSCTLHLFLSTSVLNQRNGRQQGTCGSDRARPTDAAAASRGVLPPPTW